MRGNLIEICRTCKILRGLIWVDVGRCGEDVSSVSLVQNWGPESQIKHWPYRIRWREMSLLRGWRSSVIGENAIEYFRSLLLHASNASGLFFPIKYSWLHVQKECNGIKSRVSYVLLWLVHQCLANPCSLPPLMLFDQFHSSPHCVFLEITPSQPEVICGRP